jgi:glyceraldehyde 3-phosphate dehydrogenase
MSHEKLTPIKMAKSRVAINGFGRIGRIAFRANFLDERVDVVAINDPGNVEQLAHLLKYDSVYGILNADIKTAPGKLIINGKEINFYNAMDPATLPWKDNNIDIDLECTGFFCDKESASKHLTAGAKKVIISAPGKNVDATFCMGINEETYDPATHVVVSNASCTTNALTPVTKVIDENFGIVNGLMTTAHAYTGDQRLTDSSHKDDLRRARAATLSIIPTSTGAAKAVGLVMPSMKGKLDGLALRVPTPTVSIVDIVFNLKKATTKEEVNAALTKASETNLKGILAVTNDPVVSMDLKQNKNSSIVDLELTTVIDGTLLKVMTWYDNEWGYSERLIDMAAYMASKMA